MFLTSDAEEVNRNFDAKQECATRSASVLANLSPFRFEVQSGSFLYSRHVDKASANAETPKIVPVRVLHGLFGPAEQKGHRRLSGTTGIAGIIDLLMVVICPGSPPFFSNERSRVPRH